MSQGKKDENKVFRHTSRQISVSAKAIDLSPQISSAFKCTKTNSTLKKSVVSKPFSWNQEKPRRNSEYVDKKYNKPFNKVAPELRVIGGLGEIKCLRKSLKQHPLVNRPTLVQKLTHTTTKLLPNFTLTEQLRPIKCHQKKQLSLLETTETVKFAENLQSFASTSLAEQKSTKDLFNNKNPFNLDLNALSEYQKQKYNAEETEKRRNYQIIRRTMETKALKTEGVERLKQEIRDEKFQLPTFFKVFEADEDVEAGDERKLNDHESSINIVLPFFNSKFI